MGLLGKLGSIGFFGVAGLMATKKKKKKPIPSGGMTAPATPVIGDPLMPAVSRTEDEGFSNAFSSRAKQIDEEERKRRKA